MRTLQEAIGKSGWRLHAYVLMTNHYHLLLETPQANLVRGMRFAAGESNEASGRNASALGSGAKALGENSTALGDHTLAQGAGQLVAGSYNAPLADPSSALFVLGNGTSEGSRSNAMRVSRNGDLSVSGDATVAGNLNVAGVLTIPPQGDLSMGEFTQGGAQ